MRKLALLLGSLLVVASASAKEVVPAPVVVEEAPVQVIEKEVIVYRDKEDGMEILKVKMKDLGMVELITIQELSYKEKLTWLKNKPLNTELEITMI